MSRQELSDKIIQTKKLLQELQLHLSAEESDFHWNSWLKVYISKVLPQKELKSNFLNEFPEQLRGRLKEAAENLQMMESGNLIRFVLPAFVFRRSAQYKLFAPLFQKPYANARRYDWSGLFFQGGSNGPAKLLLGEGGGFETSNTLYLQSGDFKTMGLRGHLRLWILETEKLAQFPFREDRHKAFIKLLEYVIPMYEKLEHLQRVSVNSKAAAAAAGADFFLFALDLMNRWYAGFEKIYLEGGRIASALRFLGDLTDESSNAPMDFSGTEKGLKDAVMRKKMYADLIQQWKSEDAEFEFAAFARFQTEFFLRIKYLCTLIHASVLQEILSGRFLELGYRLETEIAADGTLSITGFWKEYESSGWLSRISDWFFESRQPLSRSAPKNKQVSRRISKKEFEKLTAGALIPVLKWFSHVCRFTWHETMQERRAYLSEHELRMFADPSGTAALLNPEDRQKLYLVFCAVYEELERLKPLISEMKTAAVQSINSAWRKNKQLSQELLACQDAALSLMQDSTSMESYLNAAKNLERASQKLSQKIYF